MLPFGDGKLLGTDLTLQLLNFDCNRHERALLVVERVHHQLRDEACLAGRWGTCEKHAGFAQECLVQFILRVLDDF